MNAFTKNKLYSVLDDVFINTSMGLDGLDPWVDDSGRKVRHHKNIGGLLPD
ncbi:MAG: hypothetical protein KTR14_08165 [Vampirovibrio sp.]|nr:hypothetical protein [Vampirovibrio sp.]